VKKTGRFMVAKTNRLLLVPLVLLFAAWGCASAPSIVALPEDPRFQELLKDKPAQLPYRLCIGTVKLGFDAAKFNKGEVEKHALVPELELLRERFAKALGSIGLFKQVEKLSLRPDANLAEMLQVAWDENYDLLLDIELKCYTVSFEGCTGWYVPNLVLWFCTWAPSWWVRDETYKLEMEFEANFYSVHSDKLVHSETFKVKETRNLDDFQRGWKLLGVLTVPSSLKASNWKRIHKRLAPSVMRKAEIALAENVLTKFKEAVPTQEFQSAMQKTLAVVVGLSMYKDRNIPKLGYATEDALGIHTFLVDDKGGGLLEKHALLLRDEKATKQAIIEGVTEFLQKKARPWDRVVLYFAGFGATVRESDNEAEAGSDGTSGAGEKAKAEFHLATYDTVFDRIQKTAISLTELAGLVDGIDLRQCALIFDTSFSSELSLRALSNLPGVQGNPFESLANKENKVVMASCGLGEGALEISDLRHGIFTYYLLEGLKGDADGDKDGVITAKEAFEYLSKRAVLASSLASYPQHPMLIGEASEFPLKTPRTR
jgi:hypothetical protein